MSSVCDTVDFASNPAGTITAGIGAWIATSMGELAAASADLAVHAVNSTTAIDLDATWFRANYALVLPIGLILTVGTFCLQLMQAAWRRDERALAQAVTGTITGVLFSFCAISFTSVAVTVTDALSDGLFSAAGTSISQAVRRVVTIDELMGPMYQLGWILSSLVALGVALGCFLYWGVMIARKVGVLVLVTLATFAGAGGGWEAAKRWRRGWIEATATLVVSKLLMTIVFLTGISAMGKTDPTDGLGALSDALAGLVVLLLVLLCPYATYKFVHWATEGGGHDDTHRSGAAGALAAAGAAKTAGGMAMRASTGAPAPQGPSQVPGADSSGVDTGINPTGDDRPLSKEGIDSTTAPKTTFRYGEDPSAEGDGGQPLLRRPGIPPLITHPSQDSPAPATAPVPPPVGGGSPEKMPAPGMENPGGSGSAVPPAGL
jgi:hypothetical protein